MKLVRLKVPKKLKTAHWVLGYNVHGKDIIEIPENRVRDFKKLGYKEVKEKQTKEK